MLTNENNKIVVIYPFFLGCYFVDKFIWVNYLTFCMFHWGTSKLKLSVCTVRCFADFE